MIEGRQCYMGSTNTIQAGHAFWSLPCIHQCMACYVIHNLSPRYFLSVPARLLPLHFVLISDWLESNFYSFSHRGVWPIEPSKLFLEATGRDEHLGWWLISDHHIRCVKYVEQFAFGDAYLFPLTRKGDLLDKAALLSDRIRWKESQAYGPNWSLSVYYKVSHWPGLSQCSLCEAHHKHGSPCPQSLP